MNLLQEFHIANELYLGNELERKQENYEKILKIAEENDLL